MKIVPWEDTTIGDEIEARERFGKLPGVIKIAIVPPDADPAIANDLLITINTQFKDYGVIGDTFKNHVVCYTHIPHYEPAIETKSS